MSTLVVGGSSEGYGADAWVGCRYPRAGILNGSIKYGDAAVGMKQGLLLSYMGITAKGSGEASYALNYLRNRVESLSSLLRRSVGLSWPCLIAQYLLGDIASESVLEEVERQPKLALPDAAARIGRGRRFRLNEAMFYGGVKSRVDGEERRCLS